MKNHLYFILPFLVAMLLVSCLSKNLFDKEIYRYYITTNYPVDTLEQDHPWTLIERKELTVVVPDSNFYKVQIFNNDPYAYPDAEILSEQNFSSDGTAQLTFDIPLTQDRLHALFLTRDSRYYHMPFSPLLSTLRYSANHVTLRTSLTTHPYQTFTYLFEGSFPTPDDFDYNDLVLRVSSVAPGHDLLRFTVTLSAVGCSRQVAGAIRLPGISYEQVSEVTISGGLPMDEGYPFMRTKLDIDGDLARGRGGDAVICLFEDAHWAMRPVLSEMGTIVRAPYNTELFNGEDSVATMPTVTRTYNIYLDGSVDARSIKLSDMDPFIIESNNGINFEVHTYKHKFEETIWQYMGDDKKAYDDYLAWALLVPDANFLYPVEEVPLGTYRNGELYGAYGQHMHSFGQWGRNYKVAYDWWKYPIKTLVYNRTD